VTACGTNALWPGNMYIYEGDVSVGLIYDSAGNLAGYQAGVAASVTSPNIPPFQFVVNAALGNYYALTFYFVDPQTICKAHLTKRKFKGMGDRLVMQNGKNGSDLISFPLKESEVKAPWVQGQCFYTMGQHYWYNISANMDCNYFYPVFLMYNKGVLNAFGPDCSAGLNSTRWEHPTASELGWFFKEATLPQCLLTQPALSTMHVYMTSAYWNYC